MREMFETRTMADLPGRVVPASHLVVRQKQVLRDMIPGYIGRDDGDSGDN